jgi:hypothetical protein
MQIALRDKTPACEEDGAVLTYEWLRTAPLIQLTPTLPWWVGAGTIEGARVVTSSATIAVREGSNRRSAFARPGISV